MEEKVAGSSGSEGLSSENEARRDFLRKAGRFAAVTPPAIAVLLGTSLNSRAIASSVGARSKPGWGFGDKNHIHTGPPGLVNNTNNVTNNGNSNKLKTK